jgi:uncharacterized protein YyaL (SSP411 family)
MNLHARLSCLAAFALVTMWPVATRADDTAEQFEGAVSPYLREHAAGNVDWYTWSNTAVARARDKKRPVLMLLGRYGSHSDRVMERAFFDEAEWRETLQKKCALVLVDRDERPDLDDALRLLARQGTDVSTQALDGTLVALFTPDLHPIVVRPLTPEVATDLSRLLRAMRESEGDMETRADIVMDTLEAAQRPAPARGALGAATLTRALDRTAKGFHALRGYYTLTPGRPSPGALRFLIAEGERTHRADLVRLASRALTTLARSGLHDHVGGGFFRTATDLDMSTPRFDKTLVGNALLLDVFLRAYALTGEALPRETARDVSDWALREMRESSGAFIHGLDSEDDRGDGAQYLWTGEQLRTLLGRDGGTAFFSAYRLSGDGILMRTGSDVTAAQKELERLRARRRDRPQPHRDERIFVGENGLMIAALVRSARALDRASDLSAARRAAEAIFERFGQPEQLRRSARGTLLGESAMLDDFAGMLVGLLALDEAQPDPRWRSLATRLADEALRRFLDPAGGFFMTDDAHAPLLVRVKSAEDAGRISANALMAEGLARLAVVTGQKRYGQMARKTVDAFIGDLERNPFRMEGLAAVASGLVAEPATAALPVPAAMGARDSRGPVTVQLALATDRVQPQQSVEATLYLSVAAPWELVGPQARRRDLAPFSVTLLTSSLNADAPRYPAARTVKRRWSPAPTPVLSGQTSIVLPIRAPDGSRIGEHRARVRVSYQRCDASECQAPETLTVEAPLTVVAPPSASPESTPATE